MLQTRAHKAADALKAGTWQPPTATDVQLARGIGGSNMVINHARDSQSNRTGSSSQMQGSLHTSHLPPFLAPSQQQEPGVGATVLVQETTQQPQLLLEGYLRSFESGAFMAPSGLDSNTALAGSAVDSRNQFLRGILSSDWTSYATSSTAELDDPLIAAPNYAAPFGEESGIHSRRNATTRGEVHAQLFGAPIAASLSSSDGGGSSTSAPRVGMAGYTPDLPPELAYITSNLQEQMNVTADADAYSAEQQAAFLWDNILRELGIPTQGG